MNFTITDKNGNKRAIELTEDKEKLGGVEDKLVIIKDGKKYYAPLVEKAEEKYPRMYVIKKDGIKRYVTQIETVPSGVVYSGEAKIREWDPTGRGCHSILAKGKFIVPRNITMLKLQNKNYIKVYPGQKLHISYSQHNGQSMWGSGCEVMYFVNSQIFAIFPFILPGERLKIEYSKEINEYKGSNIIDVTSYGDWEDYDKSDIPEFKEMKDIQK